MNDSPAFREIYDYVIGRSEPYRLPELFDFLAPAEDAYCCPRQPEDVLAGLRGRFSEKDLLSSGVVLEDDNGHIQLHPVLADAEQSYVVLRQPCTEEVWNLLTEQGCIAGNFPPVLAVLGDHRTRVAMAAGSMLCVCFSLSDVVLLRRLGFAATLSVGMVAMSLDEIEAFCEVFEIGLGGVFDDEYAEAMPGKPSIPGPDDPRLRPVEPEPVPGSVLGGIPTGPLDRLTHDCVLMAWSPASIADDQPPGLAEILSWLAELEKQLGMDVSYVSCCTPKEEDLARLRFTVERGGPAWSRRAMGGVLERGLQGMDRLGRPVSRPTAVAPVDYVAARSALERSLLGGETSSSSRAGLQRAWGVFSERLDRDIVDPLRRSALATLDPVERNLRLAMAEASRGLIRDQALADLKMSQAVGRDGIGRTETTTPEQSKRVAQGTETVLKLAQEIRKCQEMSLITVTAAPVKYPPRPLPASASAPQISNS